MSDELTRDALPIGSEVGGYIVQRILGQGGFGITYAASSATGVVDRAVAIKEFFPHGLAYRDDKTVTLSSRIDKVAYDAALRRFESEARKLVDVYDHPNIVRGENVIHAYGSVFLIMEFVDGVMLQDWVTARGGLSEIELRKLMGPVFDAVTYLHGAQAMHRDLSPRNIMIRTRRRGQPVVEPVVIDFGAIGDGLDLIHDSTITVANPLYSPPEQQEPHGVTQGRFTDVFALGGCVYFCTTGKAPVKPMTRLAATAHGQPDPLPPARHLVSDPKAYGEAFFDGLDRALRLDPKARPATVEALSSLLGWVTLDPAGRDATTMLARPQPEERPKARRSRGGLWLGVAFGALVAAGAAVVIGPHLLSQPAPPAAKKPLTISAAPPMAHLPAPPVVTTPTVVSPPKLAAIEPEKPSVAAAAAPEPAYPPALATPPAAAAVIAPVELPPAKPPVIVAAVPTPAEPAPTPRPAPPVDASPAVTPAAVAPPVTEPVPAKPAIVSTTPTPEPDPVPTPVIVAPPSPQPIVEKPPAPEPTPPKPAVTVAQAPIANPVASPTPGTPPAPTVEPVAAPVVATPSSPEPTPSKPTVVASIEPPVPIPAPITVSPKPVDLVPPAPTPPDHPPAIASAPPVQPITAPDPLTVPQLALQYAALSPDGGVVSMPRTAADVYHNARFHEQRGEALAARQAYLELARFDVDAVDAWTRFATVLRVQDGRAGARDVFAQLAPSPHSTAYDLVAATLYDDVERKRRIEAFVGAYPDYGPGWYLMADELSEARLGSQTLGEKHRESEALSRFLKADEEGELVRHFMDPIMLGNWIDAARRRKTALDTILEHAQATPAAIFSRSNAGWMVSVQLPEAAIGFAYRLGSTGVFTPTDPGQGIDPRTGKPMPNTLISLVSGQEPKEIDVRYTDLRGVDVGPFPIAFDPTAALVQQVKMTLNMTKGAWVAFGGYGGTPLMYMTHLASYVCGIEKASFGLDGSPAERPLPLPACNPKDPYAIPNNYQPYLKVPPSTKSATVRVVFKDGTSAETVITR